MDDYNATQAQKGATLLVALVMLLVMTIIGISSMHNSTLEERMAGNVKEQYRAFQAAEMGMRAAEKAIDAGAGAAMTCNSTFKDTGSLGNSDFSELDGNAYNTEEARSAYHFRYCGPKRREYRNDDGDTASSDAGAKRRFFVNYYTMTSVGQVSENTEVKLVSSYGIR
jgi:hypothetical protein